MLIQSSTSNEILKHVDKGLLRKLDSLNQKIKISHLPLLRDHLYFSFILKKDDVLKVQKHLKIDILPDGELLCTGNLYNWHDVFITLRNYNDILYQLVMIDREYFREFYDGDREIDAESRSLQETCNSKMG
jgi:hypothetical protein